MSMQTYSWKFRITAWSIIVILVVILCEVLSHFYLKQRLGILASLYKQNPNMGYFHVPEMKINFHFEDNGFQSTHNVSINSKGLRDKERTYDKQEKVHRILVLGDSMVFAHQVEKERRFTEILESELNRVNNKNHYEVINAGVSGYGTVNELLFFLHEGFKYQPDTVVLSFCITNDVMDNSHILLRKEKPYFIDRPYYILEDGVLSLRNYPCKSSIVYLSSVYRLISNATGCYFPKFVEWANGYGLLSSFPLYGEYIQEGIPLHMRFYSKTYAPDWVEAWDITKALITKFRDEVIKRNARFVVLIIPDKLQLNNIQYWEWTNQNFPAVRNISLAMDKPSRLLNTYLSENGIPFVDLLPLFYDYERVESKPLYFKNDIHLNEQGHKLVAQILLKSLLNERILKDGIIWDY